jgi:hypothetical protein
MAAYAAATVASYADALNAVTFAAVEPNKVYDQVFDTSPLFAVMKTTNHLKEQRGGLFIQRQFNIGKSPNAGWYTGAGGWKLAKFEGLIAGGWDWKLAHDAVLILGEEILRNSGADEAIVDLVQERVDVMSLTLPDLIATDFYANNPYGSRTDTPAGSGTANAGNPASIEGLAVLVDDGTISNTVGSLSRTTYPSLKAQVNYNNALGASFINSIQSLYIAANRGQSSRVRLNLTTPTIYGAYWSSLQSPERYVIDPRRIEAIGLKTTGGNDLAFNDAPVLIDEKCPSGVVKPGGLTGSGGFWYGLNLDWFDFVVHPDRFFTLSEWMRDQYGDQYFMDVFFAGALVCNRPNKQFVTWVSGG